MGAVVRDDMHDRIRITVIATGFDRAYDPASMDEYAAEAQYLMGEIGFEGGQYQRALEDYLKVKYLYPSYAEWVGRGLLRVGECYEKMDQKNRAKTVYEEVARTHRDDEIGEEAKRRLGQQ